MVITFLLLCFRLVCGPHPSYAFPLSRWNHHNHVGKSNRALVLLRPSWNQPCTLKNLSWTSRDRTLAKLDSVRSPTETSQGLQEPHPQDPHRKVVESFVSTLQESIAKQTFVSFTLRGPSGKKKQSKKSQSAQEDLNGCIRLIQGRLVQIKNCPYMQVTFKYHGATDIAKNWKLESDQELQNSLWRLFYPHEGTNHDKNTIQPSEWGKEKLFSVSQSAKSVQSASLMTMDRVWDLDVAYATKIPRLLSKASDATSIIGKSVPSNMKHMVTIPAAHDRVKQTYLSPQEDFLTALGVTTTDGKPRQAMSSKLRQCQKFVEIVANLVERALAAKSSGIDQDGLNQISVLDMGCGRGYLTFSLHAYLYNKFVQDSSIATVHSKGIDMRPKLVKEVNDIASSLGPKFENLSFHKGSIEESISLMMESTKRKDIDLDDEENQTTSLSILIALHACDTATDDALWSGISSQANIIVVAPCCHKQVRSQVNMHLSGESSLHPLGDILRHNVYKERHSETVTDSMRALLLEMAGYNVQVFEFIGGEHTAKNVMITAVRKKSVDVGKQKEMRALRTRLHHIASMHGVKQQKLAKWMGEEEVLMVDPSGLVE